MDLSVDKLGNKLLKQAESPRDFEEDVVLKYTETYNWTTKAQTIPYKDQTLVSFM